MALMSGKRALTMANGANSYVQSKMKLGASNNPSNTNYWTNSNALSQCVADARKEITDWSRGQTMKRVIYALKKAEVLERTGCGNCEEQSSLAIAWLMKHRVAPIEIMEFSNGDHFFCTVNRDARTDPTNPDQWNENSVYCDPWRNTVTPGREMSRSNRRSSWGVGTVKYHFSVVLRIEAS